MIELFKIDFQLTNSLRGSHTPRAGKLFCHDLSYTPCAARRIAAERYAKWSAINIMSIRGTIICGITIFFIFNSFLMSQNNKAIYDKRCKDNNSRRVSIDDSNYDYYYSFIKHPTRRVGKGVLPDIKSYQISGFKLGMTKDSILTLIGEPECVVSYKGFNSENVELYYYNGLRFTFVSYNIHDIPKISKIATYRNDIFSTDSIHCEMKLNDVVLKLSNVKLTCLANCDATGILSIQRIDMGPFFELIFIDGELITIILDDGTG